MIPFPGLCPIRRSYTPGKYQTKRYNSVSGAGTTRLYGDKAFDARMELEYIADDATTEAFADSWHESKGNYYPLTVEDKVFGPYKAIFPPYLEWRWAEEPQFQSIQPHLTRVNVRLIGTLEIKLKDSLGAPDPTPEPTPDPTPEPTEPPVPTPSPTTTPNPTPTPTTTPGPTPTPTPGGDECIEILSPAPITRIRSNASNLLVLEIVGSWDQWGWPDEDDEGWPDNIYCYACDENGVRKGPNVLWFTKNQRGEVYVQDTLSLTSFYTGGYVMGIINASQCEPEPTPTPTATPPSPTPTPTSTPDPGLCSEIISPAAITRMRSNQAGVVVLQIVGSWNNWPWPDSQDIGWPNNIQCYPCDAAGNRTGGNRLWQTKTSADEIYVADVLATTEFETGGYVMGIFNVEACGPQPTPSPSPTPTPTPTPTTTPGPTPTPTPTPTSPPPSGPLFAGAPVIVPEPHRSYMQDAMDNLSKYIRHNPGYTAGPIEVRQFEVDENRNAVAWCYYGSQYVQRGGSGSDAWTNTIWLKMGVNPLYNNQYSANKWRNVWQHEILHGMGISWWNTDSINRHMSMDNESRRAGYLSQAVFPGTLDAYKINAGMSTAKGTPLRGGSSAHWLGADKVMVVEGEQRTYKKTRDVMARALSDGALLTNVSLATLARYGWQVTYLPNNPPNPFPTYGSVDGEYYCLTIREDENPYDPRILNYSESLELM